MSAHPEISIHDNDVYAYSVDCQNRRLTLHTQSMHREPPEYTDIIFRGVVAHYFVHVLEGNILFSVEEVPIEHLVRDYASDFEKSWRFGWPPIE
jgi:hypothetical protein